MQNKDDWDQANVDEQQVKKRTQILNDQSWPKAHALEVDVQGVELWEVEYFSIDNIDINKVKASDLIKECIECLDITWSPHFKKWKMVRDLKSFYHIPNLFEILPKEKIDDSIGYYCSFWAFCWRRSLILNLLCFFLGAHLSRNRQILDNAFGKRVAIFVFKITEVKLDQQ